MSKQTLWTMRILGALAVIFGVIGLWYNGLKPFDVSWHQPDPQEPYFNVAFIAMSAFCILCYLALLLSGVQLIRLKSRWLAVLSGVLVAEILFELGVVVLWMWPDRSVAGSVAAATGVSTGGLSPQIVTLFPLWGIFAAKWARMVIRKESSNHKETGRVDNSS